MIKFANKFPFVGRDTKHQRGLRSEQKSQASSLESANNGLTKILRGASDNHFELVLVAVIVSNEATRLNGLENRFRRNHRKEIRFN